MASLLLAPLLLLLLLVSLLPVCIALRTSACSFSLFGFSVCLVWFG